MQVGSGWPQSCPELPGAMLTNVRRANVDGSGRFRVPVGMHRTAQNCAEQFGAAPELHNAAWSHHCGTL
eukprot:9283638-Alexandrium_andersonii.AAC.1